MLLQPFLESSTESLDLERVLEALDESVNMMLNCFVIIIFLLLGIVVAM
jgi:hypothetical protein